MPGRTIKQFMWGFQPHFRIHVELTAEAVLKSLGCKTDVEVYLVGFRVNEERQPICVEPEDGYFVPGQLQDVCERGEVLYQEHPDSQLFYSAAHLHERMPNQLRDTCRAEALKEALESHYPTGRVSFFVSQSAQVNGYEVHVAIGVPTNLLENIPTLTTRKRDMGFVQSMVVLSGEEMLTPLYDALNEVSTMRYEKRVGVGHLLLANYQATGVE